MSQQLSTITEDQFYQELSYDECVLVTQQVESICKAMAISKQRGDFFTAAQLMLLLPRFITKDAIEELSEKIAEVLKNHPA